MERALQPSVTRTPPRRALVRPWVRSSSRFRRRARGTASRCTGTPGASVPAGRRRGGGSAAEAWSRAGSRPRRRRVEHRLVRRAEVGDHGLHERGRARRPRLIVRRRSRRRPCRRRHDGRLDERGVPARAPSRSPSTGRAPAGALGRQRPAVNPRLEGGIRRADGRVGANRRRCSSSSQAPSPRTRHRTTTDTAISMSLPW